MHRRVFLRVDVFQAILEHLPSLMSCHVRPLLLRQLVKCRAFCLGVTGFTRLMIHQAFAFCALKQFIATVRV